MEPAEQGRLEHFQLVPGAVQSYEGVPAPVKVQPADGVIRNVQGVETRPWVVLIRPTSGRRGGGTQEVQIERLQLVVRQVQVGETGHLPNKNKDLIKNKTIKIRIRII